MGTGPTQANPGPSIANSFFRFLRNTVLPVLFDQNTFVVIVIDEAGLSGTLSLQHTYDTGFFQEA